jgi:hypothetical protein
LDRKAYADFLSEFLPPRDKEEIAQMDGGMTAVAADFARYKDPPELALALRLIRDEEPRYEGPRAIFKVPGSTNGRSLTWLLIDGKWYVSNH